MNIGRPLSENPLLTAKDVRPSLPELEVVSVFNAAAARVGDEVILLLRVAEQPPPREITRRAREATAAFLRIYPQPGV